MSLVSLILHTTKSSAVVGGRVFVLAQCSFALLLLFPHVSGGLMCHFCSRVVGNSVTVLEHVVFMFVISWLFSDS